MQPIRPHGCEERLPGFNVSMFQRMKEISDQQEMDGESLPQFVAHFDDINLT